MLSAFSQPSQKGVPAQDQWVVGGQSVHLLLLDQFPKETISGPETGTVPSELAGNK